VDALRLAVAQAPASCGDVMANVGTACRLLREAAEARACLVVFPELFLCGYAPAAIASDPGRFAIEPGDARVRSLAEECGRVGIAAVLGACTKGARGLANSAILIDSCGAVVEVYEKVHLWREERWVFSAGDRLLTWDLFGFRFGVAICYDAGFPEHARALALTGADVILCPSAFARGDEERRYGLYMPMRALENTLYVAAANALGSQGGCEFFGRSAVHDPTGRPVSAASEQEGVLVAVVRRSEIEEARRALPYLQERRTVIVQVAKGER
jgi:predicted amidohydrolase